jgi:hypothetical protein
MKPKVLLTLALSLVLGLAIGGGLLSAQEPPPDGVLAPQGDVGTAFTYQGRLVKNDTPVDDTCDFRFTLYDDPSAGSQIGVDHTVTNVSVDDGYFSLTINEPANFGAQAFTGAARYLEIEVQCSGDAGFVPLTGGSPKRVALNPAPYAHSLRPGAIVSGTTTALTARTSSSGAAGVYGHATASTGSAYGVFGETQAPGGAGVFGTHSGSAGTGVAGIHSGSVGYGVYGRAATTGTAGIATSTAGPTWGVYGRSDAPSGYGVYGENTSGGITFGVFGRNDSNSGAGVFGVSGADGGVGVKGETVDGHAVEGVVDWTAGGQGVAIYGEGAFYGHGGWFQNTTTTTPTVVIKNLNYAAGAPAMEVEGTAVITGDVEGHTLQAVNTQSAGITYGLFGESRTTGDGAGVYGYHAQGTGVYGSAGSSSGTGVHGYAGGGTGVHGRGNIGVEGWTDWYGGTGGRFRNVNTGSPNADSVAVWAGSYFGDIFQGHELDSNGDSLYTRFRVTYGGDVYADGSYHCGAAAGGEPGTCIIQNAEADFAEMLPADEGLEPGDVLVVGADGELARSVEAYQATVVGVYSTQPGYLGGGQHLGKADYVPLAVVGVVPVKASAENGAITPGDLLSASDTPGHVMRCQGVEQCFGRTVGKALEGLDAGTGLIQMLVMLQ